MKKILGYIVSAILILGMLGASAVFAVNSYMLRTTEEYIVSADEVSELDADCILVLGAGVYSNGDPSLMLRDRLSRSFELYDAGASDKMLMSGDHGTEEYNEVYTMKQLALDYGIASEDVFMDHAGFSTYDSMYRAREIFQVKKVVIVTQKYHLYRAIYIARSIGLDAVGVAAEEITYAGQTYRDVREILARAKDCIKCIIEPESEFLGEIIPIFGNGNDTNDCIFD